MPPEWGFFFWLLRGLTRIARELALSPPEWRAKGVRPPEWGFFFWLLRGLTRIVRELALSPPEWRAKGVRPGPLE